MGGIVTGTNINTGRTALSTTIIEAVRRGGAREVRGFGAGETGEVAIGS